MWCHKMQLTSFTMEKYTSQLSSWVTTRQIDGRYKLFKCFVDLNNINVTSVLKNAIVAFNATKMPNSGSKYSVIVGSYSSLDHALFNWTGLQRMKRAEVYWL